MPAIGRHFGGDYRKESYAKTDPSFEGPPLNITHDNKRDKNLFGIVHPSRWLQIELQFPLPFGWPPVPGMDWNELQAARNLIADLDGTEDQKRNGAPPGAISAFMFGKSFLPIQFLD